MDSRNASHSICHDTLPHYRYPHAEPAVCRGFHDDRYVAPPFADWAIHAAESGPL
jgi:hypothetical protein